jgi:ankyrin repeat protein
VADRGQSDIAAFLEVPTSTIKKRLFDARRRLKERMMSQLGDHLREQRPSQDERFMRRVQFLIAVRTGDLAVIQRQLETDPALVHVTLTREEWGRAEMGQPTLPMEFDYTPLHFAATYGQPELAELLLAYGARVDDATPGETPLSRAVLMDDVPMTELLLRHGANPNLVSMAGLTPLHRAAMRGRAAVLRTLLMHGADADQRDRSGRTAQDWAILGQWHTAIEALAENPSNTPVDLVSGSERTSLVGRVVNPAGEPLDGLGPVQRPRWHWRDGAALRNRPAARPSWRPRRLRTLARAVLPC